MTKIIQKWTNSYKINTIRLIVKYTFIINRFGDIMLMLMLSNIPSFQIVSHFDSSGRSSLPYMYKYAISRYIVNLMYQKLNDLQFRIE